MSIYSDLLELGYTDESIRSGAVRSIDLNTRTAGVVVQDTPDGVPIVGISYRCDYTAEEESGVGALAKSFRSKDQSSRVRILEDGSVAFGIADLNHTNLDHQAEQARSHNSSALPYVQGSDATNLRWKKVDEMRAFAKKHDISLKGLRKKDDILEACILGSPRDRPNLWPAWFGYGRVLIMSAGDGLFSDVLNLLISASIHDTLAVSNSSRVFSSGLGLYDSADVGPKLQAEWDAEAEFTRHHEELLVPVKEELKQKGHQWFFLGGPKTLSTREGQPQEVRYWLNGYRVNGGQPCGWYTLEELRAEKFIEDHDAKMEARQAEKEAERKQKASK